MKSHLLPTLASLLLLAAPMVQAAPASNQVTVPVGTANNVEGALVAYQVALDQIATGHLLEARVMLEENIRRNGDKPELNTLLAYLLQREGRNAEARTRLAAVAPTSPLAAAFGNALARPGAATASSMASATTGYANSGTTHYASGRSPATLPQADARLEKLEQTIAGLVNAEREQAGLEPLAYDTQLASVARAHSAEMRDLKYFAHESPTASLREPLARYRAHFNVTPSVVAENVFRAWGTPHQLSIADAQKAHTSLMNSPGHRANILFPNVTHLGVGIMTNATGDIWLTEMFSKP